MTQQTETNRDTRGETERETERGREREKDRKRQRQPNQDENKRITENIGSQSCNRRLNLCARSSRCSLKIRIFDPPRTEDISIREVLSSQIS